MRGQDTFLVTLLSSTKEVIVDEEKDPARFRMDGLLLFGWGIFKIHPRKLTYPLKNDYFSREYIFQPLIFQGTNSFVFRGISMSYCRRFCRRSRIMEILPPSCDDTQEFPHGDRQLLDVWLMVQTSKTTMWDV